MAKPRSRFLTALFNLIAPGLGFLYLNRLGLAIGWPLLMLLLFAVMAWSQLVFTVGGMWIGITLQLLLWLTGILIGVKIAHRERQQALSRYQRAHFYILFLLISIAIKSLIATNRTALFGYESFRLPSNSMRPTFQPGDYVNANTWYYRSHQPVRGDLVVFRYPPDPQINYIKRVIGLPGESVEFKKEGLFINGKLLHEPYVFEDHPPLTEIVNAHYDVPQGHYFVLGDNRNHSNDSRNWGYLPAGNIEGRVEILWFSFDANGLHLERIGKRLH